MFRNTRKCAKTHEMLFILTKKIPQRANFWKYSSMNTLKALEMKIWGFMLLTWTTKWKASNQYSFLMEISFYIPYHNFFTNRSCFVAVSLSFVDVLIDDDYQQWPINFCTFFAWFIKATCWLYCGATNEITVYSAIMSRNYSTHPHQWRKCGRRSADVS